LTATPIDPTQMQQVLVNLVKNAMQAMTTGGTLTLQTGEGADGVWVSVADTGGGIPQEQINRIFEPFYTTKKKGSGLGLMIVQRIVRAHDGRIELESHVGRGTTFRVWLPCMNANRVCWRKKPPTRNPEICDRETDIADCGRRETDARRPARGAGGSLRRLRGRGREGGDGAAGTRKL
jgi:hypothetical protein